MEIHQTCSLIKLRVIYNEWRQDKNRAAKPCHKGAQSVCADQQLNVTEWDGLAGV